MAAPSTAAAVDNTNLQAISLQKQQALQSQYANAMSAGSAKTVQQQYPYPQQQIIFSQPSAFTPVVQTPQMVMYNDQELLKFQQQQQLQQQFQQQSQPVAIQQQMNIANQQQQLKKLQQFQLFQQAQMRQQQQQPQPQPQQQQQQQQMAQRVPNSQFVFRQVPGGPASPQMPSPLSSTTPKSTHAFTSSPNTSAFFQNASHAATAAASALNTRQGNPTVEVDLHTEKGLFRAIVPSGASTGIHEALELRDQDKSKWGGKGVLTAVSNVNNIIAPALIEANIDVANQTAIDDFLLKLDGTANKSKLGANAILGVSLAAAKAGAGQKGVPLYQHIAEISETPAPYVLPVPFQNVLNGGSHAGGRLAIQEFMIVPLDFPSFSEAMRAGAEVYQILKSLAKKRYGTSAGNVGDEGGVAPDIQTPDEALTLITDAIEQAGYTGKVSIAIDAASSEFFKDGKYDLDFKNPESDPSKWLTGEQLADLYLSLIDKYPIVSLEDPFAEDDWETWVHFYSKAAEKTQIVGDDLTVTNPIRIKTAIEKKAANALLLKVNQIGTLSESIQAAKDSYAAGWGVMVSHRSGETEDTTIAEIAVGLRSGQIKAGAPARSERLAKLNEILRIEEELGDKAIYAGAAFHKSVAI